MAEPESPPSGGSTKAGVMGKLTKKVGPLPLWGWAIVAGGGILFWKLKHPKASTSTSGTGVASSGSPLPSSAGGYTYGADNASVDSFIQGLQQQLSDIQAGSKGGTNVASLRGLNAYAAQGIQDLGWYSGGAGLQSGPGAAGVNGQIPWGSQFQITGNPVYAKNPSNNMPGASVWYPVNWNGLTGWLAQSDITGPFGLAPGGNQSATQSSSTTSAPPSPSPPLPAIVGSVTNQAALANPQSLAHPVTKPGVRSLP